MTNFHRKPISQNRVVITGIGAITPIGNNLESSWKNLIENVSGIERITLFNPALYKTQIAGEVKNYNPTDYFTKKELRTMDRFIQFSLLSSRMALDMANLRHDFSSFGPEAGVIIGSGMGGLPGVEEQHKRLLTRGPGRVSPFFIPSVLANMAPARVAMEFNVQGPNFSVKSACATGIHCLGESYRYIKDGICKVMIAGSAEATICELSFAGFESLNAMSQKNETPSAASKPWDRNRDGFVMAEGAAVFVLESLEHAINRGAHILAEITGYAATSDAFHITAPDERGRGIQTAMTLALKDAELNPSDISYINAHAASTPIGDLRELQAINEVFKDSASTLSVSSSKSMTGHCLGAAGSIESAFCVMSLRDQIIPPTKNLKDAQNDFKIDLTPEFANQKRVINTLNNSIGFGGANATMIFSEYVNEKSDK